MNLITNIKSVVLRIFMLFLLYNTVYSVNASTVDTLFLSDRIIRIKLRTDFSAIQNERTDEPQYHEGILTYHTKGSKPIELSVRVMARGNFRLKPENCGFPPLLLNFSKKEVENTIFEGQNKLKLVTPCQSEEDVINEYNIYKMYNHVTDKSLKVRLAKISYIDEDTGIKLFDKYSFFIEDKDHAAARNNAEILKDTVNAKDINKENHLKLAVFQYIIGNLDWNIGLIKNIEIMQSRNNRSELYVIPFDFDFSEFVNTTYAREHEIRGISDFRRQQYLGFCIKAEELHEVFEFYRNLKPDFESIIKKQTLVPYEERMKILNYINEFYALLDNEDLVRKEFLCVCDAGTETGARGNDGSVE